MKVLRRKRRLPRLVGPATVPLGLASYAVHTVLVLAGQSS